MYILRQKRIAKKQIRIDCCCIDASEFVGEEFGFPTGLQREAFEASHRPPESYCFLKEASRNDFGCQLVTFGMDFEILWDSTLAPRLHSKRGCHLSFALYIFASPKSFELVPLYCFETDFLTYLGMIDQSLPI